MNDERMLFKNNHSRKSLTMATNFVMIFMVLSLCLFKCMAAMCTYNEYRVI
ncbi:MAG: hypothetical protein JWQ85_2491 [Mucilaginibacter sp.]|jgi:hypothetical protein|nr:hypothetical protein [Mucilaginibacter sp.]